MGSLPQGKDRRCVGLRLAPNRTYGLRKTLINDIVTGKIKISNGHH